LLGFVLGGRAGLLVLLTLWSLWLEL
jgi:hypothetical protein